MAARRSPPAGDRKGRAARSELCSSAPSASGDRIGRTVKETRGGEQESVGAQARDCGRMTSNATVTKTKKYAQRMKSSRRRAPQQLKEGGAEDDHAGPADQKITLNMG